jgi:hypothetical protein
VRKFFLAFSIFILIALLSAGIQQKINRSTAEDLKIEELSLNISDSNA